MPLPIVSPTLFNAQALPADPGDTHLQSGIHLRVSANPLLGLPVAPFVVWRAVVTSAEQFSLRSDAVFVDSRGQLLTAPFALAPDNAVTAYLPLGPGDVCPWAVVAADPAGGRAARGSGARVKSGIRATAYVGTSRGPTPLARRSAPPFAFSGPGIVHVLLEGQGAVAGVFWIEQRDVPKLEWAPWAVLNLPHPGGPRYLSVDGALLRAEARVLEQAPRRRPLQETLGAVPPSAAPPEGPVYEAKRVASLSAPLAPSLDRLITDLGAPALELTESDPLFDERGVEVGSSTQRCIDRVLQGQFDPGCAAAMGYKALDRDFGDAQPLLVLYWVSGLFRDFPAVAGVPPVDPVFDAQLALLPPGNRVGNEKQLVRTFEVLIKGLNVTVEGKTIGDLERANDYIGLGALAIADRGAAPDPMLPPSIERTADLGWLPEVPPSARREVQVEVAGVVTGGLLAGEKQTPDGGTLREQLNKANADGYHLPLALSLDAADETLDPVDEPGRGFLADRRATEDPIRYFVAQQDGFGRWSDWASAVNPPGPRPRPPRPVFRAFYTLSTDPPNAGGMVRVMVDVPALATLAPGSFPIEQLELTVTDLTTSAVTLHAEPVGDPLAPDELLDFSFEGPLLSATERRQLRLVAAWRDTEGTASVDSEPVLVTMTDPRPPAQLTVPDALLYSGRPDVLGLSMVEYAWTPVAGQARFGVYYSDENRLVAHVADAASGSSEATVRDALAATTDPAERATLLRANAGLFPASLFERLQGVVYDAGGGQQAFRHPVSGSLRVLNLYRVSAESESAARVDPATLPLLVFAVPNADPPARPVLAVVPDAAADNGAALSATAAITLTAGVTTAATWRLRRSSLGATEVLRMPVVTTGVMGPVEDDGRQHATVQDLGPVQISPGAVLQPWVRYTWVAETQGDFAPGSVAAGRPVPGVWSEPSDPVSVVLVPPLPPEPPEALTATGTSAGAGLLVDVTLAFTHPRVLAGGVMGPYRVRVSRRPPDGPLQLVAEAPLASPAGPYAVSGMLPGEAGDQVPAGTVYRLVLIDPLGRESEPADATLT